MQTNAEALRRTGRAFCKTPLLVRPEVLVDDYAAFYEQTFAPAELDPELPVEDIEPIEQHYEDEYTPEQLEQMNEEKDENASDDDGEWYGE